MNPPFVNALTVSADGRWVAAGLGDGTVRWGQANDIGCTDKGDQLHALADQHTFLVSSV